MDETRGSISVRAWLVFIGILIAGLYFAFRPADTKLSGHLIMKKNLSTIGEALLRYEHTHERLPVTIAELVPEFVSVPNALLFFPPETQDPPSSVREFRDRLENEGAFTYLGEKGRPVDTLLFERLDRFTNQAAGSVMVVGTNFGVTTHARAELERRLRAVMVGKDL